MIYLDEEKLKIGTLRMIGEDYGVDDIKYNMLSDEGIYAYLEEVFAVIDKQSEEEWDYIINCYKEDWLEGLRREGRLKEN